MPTLRFSRHARNRMRRDGIAESAVAVVLASPAVTVPSIKGRVNTWKALPGRGWLKVTSVSDGSRIGIITVTLTRRRPKGA